MSICLIRLAFMSLALGCLPALAGTIYRCDGPEGPVFRDRPCERGVALDLDSAVSDSRPMGTGLRPGERDWLRAIRGREAQRSRTERRASGRAAHAAQARRCWRKRQQLETVRARLRRGYRPVEGGRLRRRRRRYEDYLSRFCD